MAIPDRCSQCVSSAQANDCTSIEVKIRPAPSGMRPEILPVKPSERSLRQANDCSAGVVGVLRVPVGYLSPISNVGLYCRRIL